MLVELLILVVILFFCFYKWATLKYDFFKKRNIPYAKPIAFMGSFFLDMLLRRDHVHGILIKAYMKFKKNKYYGVFEAREPLLVINDPELIKKITIKDFDHFVNHRNQFGPDDDNLFGNSLFALTDQKWRDMRATLSPAFTGSKMRLMFQLVNEVAGEAMKHLKNESKLNPDGIEMEMKEYFTRYTNDSIASCAFGLTINSLAEKDNEFYKTVKNAMNFSRWMLVKMFMFSYFKPIMRYFKIQLMDQKMSKYFMRIVSDAIKYRMANNIVRPDMINLLLEAKKKSTEPVSPEILSDTEKLNENRRWTDEEMVAQCFLFFLAGFETTAILMCFTAYELMINQDVQEKLLAEVDEVRENLGENPLTYEALTGMKYLDMVLSETLRKWPPAIATDRVCVKTYTIKEEDGNDLEINVGDVIWFNFVGLHYDPDNFPDPTKFDPERFSDDNKDNIKPFTYGPFGFGPRNCIGSRLALLEAKAIIFHILSEFKFEAAKKSCIPLELDKTKFQMQPKNGFCLKLKTRN